KAAGQGQLEVLKFLEGQGADIHAVDEDGDTALHLASAVSGDVLTVSWLLGLEGCDIESRGQYGRTAFLLAAGQGQLEVLKFLQGQGADIHAVDEDGNTALHLASAVSGDVLTVSWLLVLESCDIEHCGAYGRTAFLLAAERGHLEVLQLLQEKGADIHSMDEKGNNALHLASAVSGDVSTVSWLLGLKGCDIESRGRYGRTAFLCAAHKGQLKVLKFLQGQGAAIDAVDKNGDTALHLASAVSGDVSTVSWLLGLDAYDIERCDQCGWTAFLCAAQEGQLEVLKFLQGQGAAIDAVDNNGDTALHLASLFSGDVLTVSWLLGLEGCDIESRGQYGRTAFLLAAAQEGQLEVLKFLQGQGAAIDAVDEDGDTALHFASWSGDVLTVLWLLGLKGCDIERCGQYGRTAFLLAAEKGQLEVLQLLQEKGADIHAVDKEGNNALHLASLFSGDVSTVSWLLGLEGCDIESRGQYGRTAFLLAAAQEGQLEVLKFLQGQGAAIDAVDNNGDTALHLASFLSGDVSMVSWLIHHGKLNINSCNKNQKTAFLLAAGQGHLEILKVLKDAGANIHAVDDKGNNALYYASLYKGDNKEAMVNWLRAQEAVEEQPDNHEENEQRRYALRK
ncbi:MAG: ankyrin repeat domain-containing protein, partial [Gammaproteobacteria bacterium]